METYLVGGAVRDKILGIPVKDRDWVVVGATPDEMMQAGYKAVGKDFPVFLHPKTHEEYALARTERKTGPGYHGFHFNTDVSVTLEEDLLRRDLTLNAIAEDTSGKLIDPFNGQQDIIDKVLRHVSPAFVEDPVRVLRIAKFMARFTHLGFKLASSTTQLVRTMVESGEVDNLVAERVWQEFNASLAGPSPRAFFTTMMHTNALPRIMPELAQLIDEKPKALDTLDRATELSKDPTVRFAAFCAHFTNAKASELEQFCKRLRVPKATSELVLLSARYSQQAHRSTTLNAEQMHSLLKSLDVTRRTGRFKDFLTAAKAHATIAESSEMEYPQANHLQQCAQAMANIDAALIAKRATDKTTIAPAIRLAEIAAIEPMILS